MAGFKKTPLAVLKRWDAMRQMPEVQALSHTAFRMIEGIAMEWSGQNNGAIEFTQRRHGRNYGLSHPEVFDKALSEVLASRLVFVTQPGGRNRATKYALATVPLQVAPTKPIATRHVAMDLEFIATPGVVIDSGIATPRVADCYTARSNDKSPYIRNARAHARASEIGKEKSESESHAMTAAVPKTTMLNGRRFLGTLPGTRSS
jgi:hypothetical protein